MNTKSIVAILLAFLGYFFSGWGVYAGFINQQMMYPDGLKETIMLPEAEFKIGFMAISCLIWALLLVYVFVKCGVNDWKSGAMTGATLGVLTALSVGLATAAQFHHGSLHNTLMDTLGNGITSAIAGALAGWWMSRD
jgi:hypothetical protein